MMAQMLEPLAPKEPGRGFSLVSPGCLEGFGGMKE